MPSVRITNLTDKTLNISLKQLTALHFENEVAPGATIKFKPGKVWFTVEALVDDGKDNRYSVMKSAATIGLISIAVGVSAVTAGAALLPAAPVLGTAAAAATGSTAASLAARGGMMCKSAIISHGATLAKVSATVVPKAIGQLSASLGGLTLLQSEVLSILSSPLTPATLRAKGLHTLSNLRKAHAEDKKRSAEDRERQLAEAADLEAQAVAVERGMKEREEKGELPEGEKDEKTGEVRSSGPGVEEKGVRGKTVVRKHGVYIDARKHYEIRTVGPHLAIYDAKAKYYL